MGNWKEEMDERKKAKRNGGKGMKKEPVAFAYFKSVQEFSVPLPSALCTHSFSLPSKLITLFEFPRTRGTRALDLCP